VGCFLLLGSVDQDQDQRCTQKYAFRASLLRSYQLLV